MTNDFLHEAKERGFIHSCTDIDGLREITRQNLSGYIGFDCTADSLHVGSLVQIMLLRLMQRHGHRPIALMGGGTTLIGDPSGKDESRKMLSEVQIATNMTGIQKCFDAFLKFGDGENDALMLNNIEWLGSVGYIDLLRDVGSHLTVNRMLSFDSVKLRLDREQPLTFLEFNYMIMQSYDFRELFRRFGVRLQMGGSDQWGNIVSGIDLVRRTDGVTVFGLTTPLITTASGGKMGKTENGAVWLSDGKTPAFDYWQFWRNTEDGDVGRFLRLFTDLPIEEIVRLEALAGSEINEAKRILATLATTLVHGAVSFGDVKTVTNSELPEVVVNLSDFRNGMPVFRLFALSGLAKGNGDARRLIRGGGARVNDVVVTDEGAIIPASSLIEGVRASSGKKNHRFVVGR